MRYKFVVLMIMTLILMLACAQAGATEGNVIPTEGKDRIAEQYRLESPAPVSPDRTGIDAGISAPVDLFVMICQFIVNPLVFTVHKIL